MNDLFQQNNNALLWRKILAQKYHAVAGHCYFAERGYSSAVLRRGNASYCSDYIVSLTTIISSITGNAIRLLLHVNKLTQAFFFACFRI